MDWITVVGFLLTGGIGKALVDQMLRGWRQRQLATGNHESLVDALRRSRLWWMEHTYRARRMVIEAGRDLPPIDEGQDPYLVRETHQQQQRKDDTP